MRVVSSSFATGDLDQAAQMMALAYADNRLTMSARDTDGLRLAVTREDLGPVRADSYASTLVLGYRMELTDVVVLSRITAGTIDFADRRGRFHAGPGDVMATVPGQEYRATIAGTGVQAVSVDLGLLGDVGGESGDSLRQRLNSHLVDPVRARGWSATVSCTLDAMLQTDGRPGAELLVDGGNRILAAALLSTVLPHPAEPATGHARTTVVRRAVAFIESNPDLPLLTSDVARVVGVSTDTLRAAFRRHLGTTPTAHLRRVRLDQVRTDLLDAAPDHGTTVADVARRWGFGDLARFEQRYRHAFDEPPGATLDRWSSYGAGA